MQITFVYLLGDSIYYFIHRAQHSVGFLYKVHKVHHEYHSAEALGARHAHTAEVFFTTVGVLIATIVVNQFHRVDFWGAFLGSVAGRMDNTLQHCHLGVEHGFFSFLPFPITMDRSIHAVHHLGGFANFGAHINIMDKLCGTYSAPLESATVSSAGFRKSKRSASR